MRKTWSPGPTGRWGWVMGPPISDAASERHRGAAKGWVNGEIHWIAIGNGGEGNGDG